MPRWIRRRTELRAELAEVRERHYRVTLDNLAAIYARLTGETVEPFHTPYTPFERRLAERAYAESLSRSRADEKVRELPPSWRPHARPTRCPRSEAVGNRRKKARVLRCPAC